jgi:lipoprotein NlpI
VQALARYGRGQLQFEELIARANDRGERAEAYFYEGLKRWRLGDIEQAKKLMHKVLDTEMMGFFEYDMALAYLEWGDLPRNARPPLVHSSQAETVPR